MARARSPRVSHPDAAAPSGDAAVSRPRSRKKRTDNNGSATERDAHARSTGEGRHGDEDDHLPSDTEAEVLEAEVVADADPDAGRSPDALDSDVATTRVPGASRRLLSDSDAGDSSENTSRGGGRAIARPRDLVATFLAEARRYPRLSEDDERTLGRAVREHGDREAARRLVVHNLRLVVAIAYQYRRAWANILDLFQEGSVGLMEAVKRWEPALGPRFGSYAAYWIRAYVLRFLMTNSRLIHVGNTRAGRKLFFRLERERQNLIAAGFEPTPKLLAARLDVDEKDLDEVRRHLESREVPIEPRAASDVEEGGYSLAEKIAIDQATPEDQAAATEMSDTLHQFMDTFRASLSDEREKVIWQEHLAAEEPVPLGELGARFGVSKQRMGQIADKLKRRFRDEIVAKMGQDIRAAWLSEND